MKCSYNYKGKTYTYEELVAEVQNNLKLYIAEAELSEDNLDIVFSKDVSVYRAVKNLNKIHKENLRMRLIVSGEVYNTPVSDKFIDLHDLVESGSRIDGTPYVTPYNQSQLKERIKESLIKDQGMSNTAAEDAAQAKMDEYKTIEEAAYYMHFVINKFFNDHKATASSIHEDFSKMKLPKHVQEAFNIQFITTILNLLKLIRGQIYDAVGYDGSLQYKVFFPNFKITTDIEGSEKLLYSNIDLVALDKHGTPHIFMFKVSSKLSAEQISVVELKRDYYLAFNRQMLASKGFDMSKASLNIIPISITLKDGKVSSAVFEDVQDRRTVVKKDGTNNLTFSVGRLAEDAKAVISSEYDFSEIEGSIDSEVNDVMFRFFPKRDLTLTIESSKVNSFIQSHHVREASDPEYSWEFDDRITNKVVRIKESTEKAKNQELREKVFQYLNKRDESKSETLLVFIGKIRDVVNDGAPLSKLVRSSQGTGNLQVNLGKYSRGGWKILDIPILELLGIIALLNKLTDQVDFILLTNEYHINSLINLGLGKNILGSFKKDSETENDKGLLQATLGNIQLMRLLTALNIMYEKDDTFKVLPLGDIKILNIFNGESTVVQPSMLKHSFAKLCGETDTQNNIQNMTWLSDLEMVKNGVKALLTEKVQSTNSVLSKFYAELETNDVFTSRALLEKLVQFAKILETEYSYLKDWNTARKEAQSGYLADIVNLWLLINQTIVYLKGGYFHQSLKLGLIGSIQNRNFLEGRLLATPDNISDKNISKAVSLVRESFVILRSQFSDFLEDIYHKTFKPFYEALGYSTILNTTIGNLATTFRNLYREKDGKILNQMLFKNPYDPSSDLTTEEREFLKKILWVINRRRFNLRSENSPEALDLKKSIKWFWVPLMKADGSTKLSSGNLLNSIANESKNIASGIKKSKQLLSLLQEELYTDEERVWADEHEERYEMYNRFERSESDYLSRQEMIDEQHEGFWETNVENIVLLYELAYLRKQVLDETLPIVKAYRIVLEAYGDISKVDTSDNVEYLKNFIKQAVYNRLTLSEEEKFMTKHVLKVKQLASVMMVAGNIVAPVRDVLDGMWKTIGVFVGDTWGENKGFTKKDYLWAMGKLAVPSMDTIKMCEALNKRMGISNYDINILAKRARSGRHGIFNFRDKLFWTSTAGDYFNRMSIVLAKMKHDGCFEACSFDDGFLYDWKQDERFSAYATLQTGHPLYNKQKSLYLSMLRELNELGYNLKTGDPIPFPYTPKEINIMKSFSDRMYGYYDHDVRMLSERTALGMVYLQFATYLTALKTLWFASPGMRDSLKKVLKTDDHGNPLFFKEEIAEDGSVVYVPTTEDTGVPIMETGQTYMEGIFWTVYEFFEDVGKLGLPKAWSNIRDVDVKKQNLKQLSYLLFMWAILGIIIKYLLQLWKEKREADKSPYTIAKALGDETYSIFSRALVGSLANFNIIEAIGGNVLTSEPPMVGMVTNLAISTWNTAFGDKTLLLWLKSNVSAYRSVDAFVQGVLKAKSAVNNSLNE